LKNKNSTEKRKKKKKENESEDRIQQKCLTFLFFENEFFRIQNLEASMEDLPKHPSLQRHPLLTIPDMPMD